MIDKIKRYDMKYDHDAMENAMAPDVAGDYVLFHAHEMALAAKDARIAELEQKVIGLEDYVASIPDYRHLCKELRDKLTAQQQAEPATHSEDGGEVPEVIAVRREPGHWNDPLMTVAQHERITKQLREEAATAKARQDHAEMVGDDLSRIVAAKDAEIARLDAGWHKANKKVLEISLAQPARQVGGDAIKEAFEEGFSEGNRQTDDRYHWKGYHQELAESWETSDAKKAALAPAAVAVVMPNKIPSQPYTTIDKGSKNYKAGWNSAINAFASLNRRAIPEGLIEASRRAADILGSQGFAAWDQLAAELRALLGKD